MKHKTGLYPLTAPLRCLIILFIKKNVNRAHINDGVNLFFTVVSVCLVRHPIIFPHRCGKTVEIGQNRWHIPNMAIVFKPARLLRFPATKQHLPASWERHKTVMFKNLRMGRRGFLYIYFSYKLFTLRLPSSGMVSQTMEVKGHRTVITIFLYIYRSFEEQKILLPYPCL